MKRTYVLVAIVTLAALGIAPATGLASPDVHIGIQIGAPPQLAVVPGMPVYYAPALPYNYFFYGGEYYLFHNGTWLFAPGYKGPWRAIGVQFVPRPVLRVPVAYYAAPPRHWKRHGPRPWTPAWGHRKHWKDHDRHDGHG